MPIPVATVQVPSIECVHDIITYTNQPTNQFILPKFPVLAIWSQLHL